MTEDKEKEEVSHIRFNDYLVIRYFRNVSSKYKYIPDSYVFEFDNRKLGEACIKIFDSLTQKKLINKYFNNKKDADQRRKILKEIDYDTKDKYKINHLFTGLYIYRIRENLIKETVKAIEFMHKSIYGKYSVKDNVKYIED